MPLQNTCQIVVGRLLEIDVRSGYGSVEDVDAMIRMIGEQFERVAKPIRIVIGADWRMCTLFKPEVAARAIQMLAGVNPRVERSAILHSPNQSTSVLQVMRLAREAQFSARRVFTDPLEMEKWLTEVLTEAEAQRVHLLLHKPGLSI
jgi:hypothetical protein